MAIGSGFHVLRYTLIQHIMGTIQNEWDGGHTVWVGTTTTAPFVSGTSITVYGTTSNSGSCIINARMTFPAGTTLATINNWSLGIYDAIGGPRLAAQSTSLFVGGGTNTSSSSQFIVRWTLGFGSSTHIPYINPVFLATIASEFQRTLLDNSADKISFRNILAARVFDFSLSNGAYIQANLVRTYYDNGLGTAIFRGTNTLGYPFTPSRVILYGSTLLGEAIPSFPIATFDKYILDPVGTIIGTYDGTYVYNYNYISKGIGVGWETIGSAEVFEATFYITV